ncbi:hypothetical protein SUGI_0963880 [Cryptomeria japonica]|uniref:glycerophosphodiester phosphodiesterase GDPD1, chloroplastic n=1 Tax=Cryptomeria japonica TaxID=3369 RepID=UPI002414CFFC|nr:glycerophosphodiester phosphodiesterase GDPD1, chloroplastic [Cryptomeria japonica]GLJ45804.1 hypothetical protein SUGI_0963880 [Cryptomeria japonica]
MALKALHVSDVPVTEPGGISYNTDSTVTLINQLLDGPGKQIDGSVWKPSSEFVVVGHRGSGMNKVLSSDKRMQAIMENTITSFNEAARNGVRFVEFDVQVTRDDRAVIFHDDLIVTKENEIIVEKHINELTLEEFLSYGLQTNGHTAEKPLLRKTPDGRFLEWKVLVDDSLCTLKEAFDKVDRSLGFNIELKFNDEIDYSEDQLRHDLEVIIEDVRENARGRQVFFSSFHPDAALLTRKMQNMYPVLFLTDGGVETYKDFRRNSLEAAVQVCILGGLQGIVSEVKAVLQNPGAVSKIKESNLCLLTYGQLNNVEETVYLEHLIGIDGVIVDFVPEIVQSVADFTGGSSDLNGPADLQDDGPQITSTDSLRPPSYSPPKFSAHELSFILKLIPQLIRN